jgi:hypothetical protein
MTELVDVEGFRAAMASGARILIEDWPTNRLVLHLNPRECSGVSEHWFVQKVVDNHGKNGSYHSFKSEAAARREWPKLTTCRWCS